MALNGPYQHCVFIVSPKVHDVACFRPLWTSKQGEICLKSAPNIFLLGLWLASKWPSITPQWPPPALCVYNLYHCTWFGGFQAISCHEQWGHRDLQNSNLEYFGNKVTDLKMAITLVFLDLFKSFKRLKWSAWQGVSSCQFNLAMKISRKQL